MIGLAADGDRAAVQVFPLRDGKMIDRYAFHLENVEGQDRDDDPGGVLPRVLRRRAGDPAADDRAARRNGARGARRVPLGAARLARRGARARARREAAARRARRRRTRGSRSTREATASEQKRLRRVAGARGAARGAQPREPAARGSSASTSRTSRARRSSARWRCSRTALPKKAHYRKFGVRGLDGQDDFASMAEVVSRRFARLRDAAIARSTTRASRRRRTSS